MNVKWLNLVNEHFAKDILKKKVLLIEINSRWHHSKKRKIPLGIPRKCLPAYSSELELAEGLWTSEDKP